MHCSLGMNIWLVFPTYIQYPFVNIINIIYHRCPVFYWNSPSELLFAYVQYIEHLHAQSTTCVLLPILGIPLFVSWNSLVYDFSLNSPHVYYDLSILGISLFVWILSTEVILWLLFCPRWDFIMHGIQWKYW